jgi:hypothetical protein
MTRAEENALVQVEVLKIKSGAYSHPHLQMSNKDYQRISEASKAALSGHARS